MSTPTHNLPSSALPVARADIRTPLPAAPEFAGHIAYDPAVQQLGIDNGDDAFDIFNLGAGALKGASIRRGSLAFTASQTSLVVEMTIEDKDTSTMCDVAGADPERITITADAGDGTYLVNGVYRVQSNSVASAPHTLSGVIRLNGSDNIIVGEMSTDWTTPAPFTKSFGVSMELEVGDYIDLKLYFTAQTTSGSLAAARLSAWKVSP